MIKQHHKMLCLLVAILAVSACAPKHPRIKLPNALIQPIAWRAQLDELRKIDAWDMQGRIASSESWGFSGSLDWQQTHDQFHINASGPLGIGAVELKGSPQQVTVKSGKETFITDNPAVDLQRMTGWPIPVEYLRYWVLSVPVKNRAYSIKVGDEGWPETIVQAGWRIEFKKYQEQSGFTIPRKIQVTRNDLTIKLVISEWLPRAVTPENLKTTDDVIEVQPTVENQLVPVSEENQPTAYAAPAYSSSYEPQEERSSIEHLPLVDAGANTGNRVLTIPNVPAVEPVSSKQLEALPEINAIPVPQTYNRSSTDNRQLNLLELLTQEQQLNSQNTAPSN